MIPGIDIMNAFNPATLGPTDFEGIYNLACKYLAEAKANGLLALDAATYDKSLPEVYRKGLDMVVNGADPANVKSELSGMILAKKENPRQTARNLLYMQSILSLQMGENEAVLKMRLAALSGIDALSEIIDELKV